MTDPLGQSQVIPYLQGLCADGYRIFLLSCEKREAFANNKATVQKLLEGYSIEWVPVFYTKKPPVLSTLWDVWKLKRKAASLHKEHGIAMVHTRAGVPALVGYWMKMKYRVRFLHDVREFYADSRVDGGMWPLRNPLYKLIFNYFKKQEALQVKASDGIVCLTYAAEKIIRQWPGFKKDTPLAVIPCSADLELFDPAKVSVEAQRALQQKLGIGAHDFIVSYLGSIGGWYLTAEMLRFCKVLSERLPAAKFLFISPHRHEVIAAAAEKFGLATNKIITQKATRREVPLLLSLSDYSVFFIKPCYSKQSSSPTKHGEIMAMGIPLITNSGVGDVQMIVDKYDAGIVLNDFTDAAFEAAAHAVAGKKNYEAGAIRAGAMDFYALTKAVAQYKKMYKTILERTA
jgi:glycosyltransferase involved in cell wall biosynthesis